MSETKRYTWEQKIESLVKLAKAAGRFLNTDQGTEGYKATRGHLFAVYAEFCEWRHDEPYVVDEIKALMGGKAYTDVATGIRLTVEYDNPDWPRVTVFPPEGCTLSTEEANAAIHRLLAKAGVTPPGQPGQAPPQGGKL